MARWPTGSHGGTYGGNPIGCAAAIATIDVLTEAGFLANVRHAASSCKPASRARRGGRRHHRGARARPHGRLSPPAGAPRLQEHCLDEAGSSS